MSDQEIIEVVSAHKEGKKIEVYDRPKWVEAKHPTWNFGLYDYRVAPEPRKLTEREMG